MTARPSTIEDFLACFADATGADLASSRSGTAGRHARGHRQGRIRRPREDVHADARPELPADARPERQEAACIFRCASAWSGQMAETLPTSRPRARQSPDDVIQLTAPSQTIVFSGVSSPPVPSLLLGFSAPVRLLDRPLLRRPAFSPSRRRRPIRSLAGSPVLANRNLIAATAAIAKGRGRPHFDGPHRCPRRGCRGRGLEPALRPDLQLPGEADIAREIGRRPSRRDLRRPQPAALRDRRPHRPQLADVADRLAVGGAYLPTRRRRAACSCQHRARPVVGGGAALRSSASSSASECRQHDRRLAALRS